MRFLEPISSPEFGILIGKNSNLRRVLQFKGHIPTIVVPTERMVADGAWPSPCYLAIDALVFCATEKLIAAGATRNAVQYAAQDIQANIIGATDWLHAGEDAELGLAHDGRRFAVAAARSVREAVHLVVDHFVSLGVSDASQLSMQCVNLRSILAEIRERASAGGVEFPERLWPSVDEADSMAVLAARLSPEAAPVATRWLAARESEAEAAARRERGRLD